ncbi:MULTISPECIES: Sec-independent protein translocase protein TatB [unclassified Undibacterium]|uniref:Sec-independent protein translocase protein TatB n=1 Tax=unclassified Undibacterium TaxID=2630295 RepID=UPI002AC9128E|nr:MULTISPECIES: Sec-independent protein translocase protein TatB [unclassified Undibacterium]MEB0139734.1 Sec-independent protein translocase protein TatB [Undibacterium sp. CCC2.1]MEB0172615.1 Sec-independent protein translocase protein TatB [Undibacterium sp. CCC1.1]MEB0176404.1 Sec-independent protein translocase protein TatB [Undibacterium sp. CCC3.4]MEB0215738.1 Sec-independent protein translocase protein TatB [Undibacterium sp. 5I2]WPX45161.1 Sec-independent protein translocase protein 
MIDLGISKLALIGVVALIVIGPEKLPRVARMAGTLLGRAQRYINDVKAEVSKEIELDELRKMHKDVQDAAQEVEQSVQTTWHDAATALQEPAAASTERPAVSSTFAQAQMADKAKDFRRKKLAKTSALPAWYKQRHGQRSHIVSGSARMARHRVQSRGPASFF